ncbi:hypothetical protein CALCODRAFT_559300, partial [Calocera cornea HHB12733]
MEVFKHVNTRGDIDDRDNLAQCNSALLKWKLRKFLLRIKQCGTMVCHTRCRKGLDNPRQGLHQRVTRQDPNTAEHTAPIAVLGKLKWCPGCLDETFQKVDAKVCGIGKNGPGDVGREALVTLRVEQRWYISIKGGVQVCLSLFETIEPFGRGVGSMICSRPIEYNEALLNKESNMGWAMQMGDCLGTLGDLKRNGEEVDLKFGGLFSSKEKVRRQVVNKSRKCATVKTKEFQMTGKVDKEALVKWDQ